MSDVAWARVERNVFSRMEGTITSAAAARDVRPDRGRSKWLWLAVPGAAAAAFALAFFAMNTPSPTTPEEEPSRVVAGDAPSSVAFGDAHITLDAHSAVLLDQKAGKPSALLDKGAALFAIAPRGDRGPFTVHVGDAAVRTVNGKVRVERDGERAKVAVKTGSADIRFHGQEIHIDANHSWSTDHPTEVLNSLGIDESEIQIEPRSPRGM